MMMMMTTMAMTTHKIQMPLMTHIQASQWSMLKMVTV
jgi:hypothetical protein